MNTLFKFALKSAKTKADFRETELVQGFGLSFLKQMKITIIEPKSKQGFWRVIVKQGQEIIERYRIEKGESVQWIVGNILKKQHNGN